MNNFEVGQFIITSRSYKPAFIINNIILNNQLLVSIHEYFGDYLWVDINNIQNISLACEEELSILAGFGPWFYDAHKLLYQEKIINCIINFAL
jgi:hypothetical protein